MNRSEWREEVTNGEAYARARGRRRYNAKRRKEMEGRRLLVTLLIKRFRDRLMDPGGQPRLVRGGQAKLARDFGVHRSVICRDMRALRGWLWGQRRVSNRVRRSTRKI